MRTVHHPCRPVYIMGAVNLAAMRAIVTVAHNYILNASVMGIAVAVAVIITVWPRAIHRDFIAIIYIVIIIPDGQGVAPNPIIAT